MVRVKPISLAKDNYRAGASRAGTNYTAGVNAASWQQAALNGQDLYEAQMQRPEILSRRESGIGDVSDASWRTACIQKGAQVIGARMTASVDKWANEWSSYGAALEALTLPPRTTDGMQNLVNRAGAVVQAMIQVKAQQG